MALTIKPAYVDFQIAFRNSATPLGTRSQEDLKYLLLLAYYSNRDDYVNLFVSPPTFDELLGNASSGVPSQPFTTLAGTEWDGSNQEKTLTSTLSLTTTDLPKLGLLKLKQDAVGGWRAKLNNGTLPVNPAPNSITVFALLQDAAGNFFALKDTSFFNVNPFGSPPTLTLIENKVFDSNANLAPWQLVAPDASATIAMTDGANRLVVASAPGAGGIAVAMKHYIDGEFVAGDNLQIEIVIHSIASGQITVTVGNSDASEFQQSFTSPGTYTFPVPTAGITGTYIFVGAGGALPEGNGVITSIKIEKE